jgi:hypothetical protein
MSAHGLVRGVLVLGLVLGALPALADPCLPEARGLLSGPLQVGLREGELGLAHRACATSELVLQGEAGAVVDLADFYGQLRGALRLSGSYALGDATELFGSMELFRYQTVISSVSAAEAGVGHLSLGGLHRFWSREDLSLAAVGRLVLPTATGIYRRAWPVGLDAGVAAEQVLGTRWRLNGQLGLISSAAFSDIDSQPRLGLAATVGAGWQARSWLAVLGELHATSGYSSALDVLAVGLGVRMGGERLGTELSALVPVAGQRAPIGLVLRASWGL